MKSKNLVILFIIVALLSGLLTACQDAAAPEVSDTATPKGNESTPTPGAETSRTEEEENGGFKLPIVDEKVELTIWTTYAPAATTRLASEYDNPAVIEMEKRTNVRINHLYPSSTDAQVQFNLSISSGDYPDSYITDPIYYVGGLDKYIDDGIILDLTDLTSYFPNYQRIRTADEDTRRRSSTDAGRIPGIYEIVKRPQPSFIGLVTRGDLLDSWG